MNNAFDNGIDIIDDGVMTFNVGITRKNYIM